MRDRQGNVTVQRTAAPIGKRGGVGISGVGLRPDAPTTVFLSGCSWTCSGGGQRPVALAREMAAIGHQVVYCNRLQGGRAWGGGPLVLGPDDLCELLPDLPDTGTVICGLAEYLPLARRLQARGYDLVYDVVDDWAAFAEVGEAPWFDMDRERELMDAADLITCSAPALQEYVSRICGREAVLVRNGGPVAPIGACKRPNDMLIGHQATAVLVGYLYGQWFDWDLLEATVRALPKVVFNVIGAYTSAPDLSNLHMLGERPYPEAMAYVANADVGLIPFRGERLCQAVDPIKWYDYLAGPARTVASAAMTDIAGRPGTWLQQSGEDSLAPAIERALAEPRMTDREQRALLLQTSWRHRRAELREAIARMRGRRQGANKRARAALRERSDLQPEDCALRVTWTGTAECNMQPVCPYCSTRWTRAERPAALPRTPQAIVGALMRLTAARGPLYISLCYGDPLSSDDSAWIIGQLARYNRVDVVSNILFPIERLRSLVPANGNVAFATSFHPHAWGGDVERFIAKRREIDGAGFRCGMTEIVGYPPYLSRLAEWRETLAGAGVTSSALPFCGQYAGKTYPDEYTDSHWSIVLGAMRDVYGTEHSELARRTSPAGRMCRCGRDYIWIDWDGTMWRCSMPQDGGRLGNLFGDYELLTVPAVCTAMACPCPDLWRYVEG